MILNNSKACQFLHITNSFLNRQEIKCINKEISQIENKHSLIIKERKERKKKFIHKEILCRCASIILKRETLNKGLVLEKQKRKNEQSKDKLDRFRNNNIILEVKISMSKHKVKQL